MIVKLTKSLNYGETVVGELDLREPTVDDVGELWFKPTVEQLYNCNLKL
jgi:hypothetical protein